MKNVGSFVLPLAQARALGAAPNGPARSARERDEALMARPRYSGPRPPSKRLVATIQRWERPAWGADLAVSFHFHRQGVLELGTTFFLKADRRRGDYELVGRDGIASRWSAETPERIAAARHAMERDPVLMREVRRDFGQRR